MTNLISVAVVHNLKAGGARRVMAEQVARLTCDVREFCLGTSEPVTPDATVVPYKVMASRVPSVLRPPVRYADFINLLYAWARLARAVNEGVADVVVAHPCQFLQTPPALLWMRGRSIYFCHEPRRVDYEAAA